MFTKTITYENFDGETKEAKLYFNLTKFELLELQIAYGDKLDEHIKKITAAGDNVEIMEMFKDLIKRSYGQRIDNTFRKSNQAAEDFLHSEEFSEFIMMLMQDENLAIAFVNGIIPNIPNPEAGAK